MLALYSEVGENDAPTVIYEGSHIDIARLLSQVIITKTSNKRTLITAY